MDDVMCNWCEWTGLVDYHVDTCPNCAETGYLMDIKQEVL